MVIELHVHISQLLELCNKRVFNNHLLKLYQLSFNHQPFEFDINCSQQL